MERKKIIILGAAGRDFHNFNVHFRDNESYDVVAFTAAQIPDIDGRMYPGCLAGHLYPNGIPIYPESALETLIAEHDVDEVIMAYSDLPYGRVMQLGSRVLAKGADFTLMGPKSTMLTSTKPVIAICASRTGSGKSQVSRKIARMLKGQGYRVAAIRHPMPYGDLSRQVCQRFETYEDLDRQKTTIEEREEYEPHIDNGILVFAGVDYERILRAAEQEADVIIWDGGNNDFSFYHADLYLTVVDPLRSGNELSYYPGEANVRMADVCIINKIDTACGEEVRRVRSNIMALNPDAVIIEAASPITVDDPGLIRGKRVLVIEDGPTMTHGGMAYGAGYVAAQKYGAKEIVDPRPHLAGALVDTFMAYPHLSEVLPAMGYGAQQVRDLEATVRSVPCDTVVMGTPIDLTRVMKIDKPYVRVAYELEEVGTPTLGDVLAPFLKEVKKGE
ncbi:MAG: cyclic 2,3-diphosphoglycerate synthase [Candidatus Methanofastidiosa archaeon]|nr:cyclic 2,3-diphosphoglycerate synthase [Candidatus Methanofastidiosa archaeon]